MVYKTVNWCQLRDCKNAQHAWTRSKRVVQPPEGRRLTELSCEVSLAQWQQVFGRIVLHKLYVLPWKSVKEVLKNLFFGIQWRAFVGMNGGVILEQSIQFSWYMHGLCKVPNRGRVGREVCHRSLLAGRWSLLEKNSWCWPRLWTEEVV